MKYNVLDADTMPRYVALAKDYGVLIARAERNKVEVNMPIRTRRKTVKEPRHVLPKNNRVDEVVKDEYYYLSFLWRNTIDDFQDTVDLIKNKGMPFEWSKSPSNCMCFRIKRTDWKKFPNLVKTKGKKYERDCPAFMPYSSYGNEQLWQMEEHNHFPYLYTSWTPVLNKRRVRRKRKESI